MLDYFFLILHVNRYHNLADDIETLFKTNKTKQKTHFFPPLISM